MTRRDPHAYNITSAGYVSTGRRPVRTSGTARKGGVNTATVLLIVFVVLKLTDNIDWPWLWVLSPLWVPFALILAVLVVAGGFALGAAAWNALAAKVRQRRARR